MKKWAGIALIISSLGISSWAQEVRHELTFQGSGFFNKETSDGGITNRPTNSGGVMAGYRFNLKKWLAVEGDYDYFRNEQKFLASTGTTLIPMNVHAATGIAVVKLPAFKKLPAVKLLSPFVLAGGGAMFFDPRGGATDKEQTRGAFVYGGGFDVPVMKHVALRAQYRGFIYKIPDFEMTNLKVDKYTHSAVPSAGLVFTF
ncbi:MAG TPA: outer membrane beta-barrel protein [Dongiaceae bacterium]|nr:outer membrane beta-barrel protein [Dongiaceae bacterium]